MRFWFQINDDSMLKSICGLSPVHWTCAMSWCLTGCFAWWLQQSLRCREWVSDPLPSCSERNYQNWYIDNHWYILHRHVRAERIKHCVLGLFQKHLTNLCSLTPSNWSHSYSAESQVTSNISIPCAMLQYSVVSRMVLGTIHDFFSQTSVLPGFQAPSSHDLNE